MLVAYMETPLLKINDTPGEGITVPLPIELRTDGVRLAQKAARERPDIK
jgi:hypothetical protein